MAKSRWLAALTFAICVAPMSAAQTVLVGRVESVKVTALLQDVMPSRADTIWHGEVYELDVTVLKIFSGVDPGENVKVKVTAHARDFEGLMITLIIDPELKMQVPGQSWWAPTNYPEPACVPKKLVEGAAYKAFVERSFQQDDDRCVRL